MGFFAFFDFLLFFFLLINPCLSSVHLNPPPGNSITLTTVVKDGREVYECKNGENGKKLWVPMYQVATLRDSRNESVIVGNYVKDYNNHTSITNAGTWSLLNNAGDQAESGHSLSMVSGKKVIVDQNGDNIVSNFLAQATFHKYSGTTTRISYIGQHNGTLLSKLPSTFCETNRMTYNLYFKATYVFWTQDFLPPPVPSSLSLPTSHRPALSFFGQGVVKYVRDNQSQPWTRNKMVAHLYDIPGGVRVGGFNFNVTSHIVRKHKKLEQQSHKNGNVMCINIDDPNGFHVCGVESVTPKEVTSSSLPWSMFEVTKSGGNIASILGPFTFVHFVSTVGGLAPPNSTYETSASSHLVWKSPFTAILWLYTNREV